MGFCQNQYKNIGIDESNSLGFISGCAQNTTDGKIQLSIKNNAPIPLEIFPIGNDLGIKDIELVKQGVYLYEVTSVDGTILSPRDIGKWSVDLSPGEDITFEAYFSDGASATFIGDIIPLGKFSRGLMESCIFFRNGKKMTWAGIKSFLIFPSVAELSKTIEELDDRYFFDRGHIQFTLSTEGKEITEQQEQKEEIEKAKSIEDKKSETVSLVSPPASLESAMEGLTEEQQEKHLDQLSEKVWIDTRLKNKIEIVEIDARGLTKVKISIKSLIQEPYCVKLLVYCKDYEDKIIEPEGYKLVVAYPNEVIAEYLKLPTGTYELERVEVELFDVSSLSVKGSYKEVKGEPGITVLRHDLFFDKESQHWIIKLALQNDSGRSIETTNMIVEYQNEENKKKGEWQFPDYRVGFSAKAPGEKWVIENWLPRDVVRYIFYFSP